LGKRQKKKTHVGVLDPKTKGRTQTEDSKPEGVTQKHNDPTNARGASQKGGKKKRVHSLKKKG